MKIGSFRKINTLNVLMAVAFSFFALSASLPALTAGIRWGKENSNTNFTKAIWVDGATTLASTLGVSGATTMASTLDVTGAINGASTINGLRKVIIYNTSATPRTLTAAESGSVIVVQAATAGAVTFNLPAAAAGLIYTFVDWDVTAADDLTIDVQTGDKINNQTAGVTYVATGDALGETVTLVAIDATEWVILSTIGTWTTGS